MDLPQTKSETGRQLLKEEYRKFIAKLEKESGKKVTVQSLKKGIEIVNAKRRAMIRLAAIGRRPRTDLGARCAPHQPGLLPR